MESCSERRLKLRPVRQYATINSPPLVSYLVSYLPIFLGIGSKDFSETLHGVTGPKYKKLHTAGFSEKNP